MAQIPQRQNKMRIIMTIEEKAKAYDEALKKMKGMKKSWETLSYNGKTFLQDLYSIFPQLVESEDEKIRNEILLYIGGKGIDLDTHNRWCAWLEKLDLNTDDANKEYWRGYREGKQLILDKYAELEKRYAQKYVEKTISKFNVGDWIVNSSGQVNQITKFYDDLDGYTLDNGVYFSGAWANEYHIWTIKDAKDGDVLAYDNGNICIFDGTIEEGVYPFAYCGITRYGFETCDRRLPFSHNNNVHPATKEQRRLLFAKMKDAGYEWDAEKKELKKIEQASDREKTKDDNYGVDGMHAAIDILTKTLGKVDGYQTDDGILEHKCAINAVKELYEKK